MSWSHLLACGRGFAEKTKVKTKVRTTEQKRTRDVALGLMHGPKHCKRCKRPIPHSRNHCRGCGKIVGKR